MGSYEDISSIVSLGTSTVPGAVMNEDLLSGVIMLLLLLLELVVLPLELTVKLREPTELLLGLPVLGSLHSLCGVMVSCLL